MTSEPCERSSTPEDGISRRSLIKKASAAGVVAWTAPVIIDSMVSPAAAGTVAAGCYKYQYNWGLVAEANAYWSDQQQPWVDDCTASDLPAGADPHKWGVVGTRLAGESNDPTKPFSSNKLEVDKNCCHFEVDGNELVWQSFSSSGGVIRELTQTYPDPECITVSMFRRTSEGGALVEHDCTTPGTTDLDLRYGSYVEFSIDTGSCPDCYLVDPAYMYRKSDLTFTGSAAADSTFRTVYRFRFDGSESRYLTWVKFWVGCSVGTNSSTDNPWTGCGTTTTPQVIAIG